jgi:ribosomal protein S18 acetylase RimI-like enzyme
VTIGDAELAEAVRADLVAMVSILHEPPVGEVHRDADTAWFRTGLASAYSNGILQADLPRDDLDEAIERQLAPFRSPELPIMWWRFVPPEDPDPDRPGFGLELADLRIPEAPDGAVIERVRDREAFDAWVEVVGSAFDDPRFAEAPSVAANRRLGFGDDAPFRHLLCRIGKEPVGAATLSLGAGVAGLGNIATTPTWRRRGIGATVAAAALLEARALGIRVAALSADPSGEGLYRKLGFREVSRHLTFVRSSER